MNKKASNMGENIKVISAFPGVGKTTFAIKYDNVADSDSSQFPKEFFPDNYIAHITNNIKQGKFSLVSSHKVVRDALSDEEIPFVLVYPARHCKEEYRQRYLNREGFNGGQAFADLITKFWDTWIDGCEAQVCQLKIELQSSEYLIHYSQELFGITSYVIMENCN